MAKRLVSLLFALMLLCSLSPVCFAAVGVSYRGEAAGFVVTPEQGQGSADLFGELKNVLPGDTLTQVIEVRHDAVGEEAITVYLRAVAAEQEQNDFLSQLRLTVEQRGRGRIYQASAGESSGLDDWTLLGTLSSGEKETLDVTLEVPLSLGNDFKDAAGQLQWEFKVEKLPTPSPKPSQNPTPSPSPTPGGGSTSNSPKTGDEASIALWLGLGSLGMLGAVCMGCVLARRKD